MHSLSAISAAKQDLLAIAFRMFIMRSKMAVMNIIKLLYNAISEVELLGGFALKL